MKSGYILDIPSHQRALGHRHERGTGMRWTLEVPSTNGVEAYGKDVWS